MALTTCPTPVTIQAVSTIISSFSEEKVAKALEQLYTNLTQFLTLHYCILNSNLLSHQSDEAQPIGFLPNPYYALLPS
jgi:hypothetical protein